MKLSDLSARLISRGFVAGAILIAGSLRASDATDQNTQGAGAFKLTGGDVALFIKEASQINTAEVALGELADRKSQNTQVKEFGRLMRKDHRAANEKLRPVALAHGVSMSETLDSAHQKKLARLQELGGTEFDQEYMKLMLRGHQAAIGKFETAARLMEGDVKEYAETTLPTLRLHLNHAKQVARAVGIDQETINSILKEPLEPTGRSENKDTERPPDSGTKPDERAPDQP